MNEEVVAKWVQRADHDLKIGKDEIASLDPATDMICFHMQQCVEKYLKAFLIFHGRAITKIHNIALLLAQCLELDKAFSALPEKDMNALTDYAVEVRYPDDFYMPTIEETQYALEITEQVRLFVLTKLKLPGSQNL